MNILITGAAGFIGFHIVDELAKFKNTKIFGIDNMNNYYDPKLKKDRLRILKKINNFHYKKIDITNKKKVNNYIKEKKINAVIHLAAQAGVRYSISNPESYFESNLKGFFNILEAIKKK